MSDDDNDKTRTTNAEDVQVPATDKFFDTSNILRFIPKQRATTAGRSRATADEYVTLLLDVLVPTLELAAATASDNRAFLNVMVQLEQLGPARGVHLKLQTSGPLKTYAALIEECDTRAYVFEAHRRIAAIVQENPPDALEQIDAIRNEIVDRVHGPK